MRGIETVVKVINDEIVSIVGIHFPEDIKPIIKALIELLLDRKNIGNAIGSIVLIEIRQKHADLLLAVLVFAFDHVCLDISSVSRYEGMEKH